MSKALVKKETESLKTSINTEENKERLNDIKNLFSKENNINIKNIIDLNSSKSINDLTRSKISKMELDIEVISLKNKNKIC